MKTIVIVRLIEGLNIKIVYEKGRAVITKTVWNLLSLIPVQCQTLVVTVLFQIWFKSDTVY